MEVKKSPQADLENKKNIFLEIGLMLALGTILFAFEWKVSGRQPADFVICIDDIQIVRQRIYFIHNFQ